MYEKFLDDMKNSLKNTDLIIVTDESGKIMYYNNFNDIYNESGNQDNIGKSIFELYPWLTKENSTIFKVIDSGEPLINQFQFIKIDDKVTVSSINSAFPLINGKGIIGAIEISTNISPEKDSPKKKKMYLNYSAKYNFDNFITGNSQMKAAIENMKKISKNDSTILIYGETGTGKEIIAHSIHNCSNRASKPFVTQNCAAIPSTLIESILFGSVKGSFTGSENRAGLFEIANGGTIYLDEINSMPQSMQSKLLRTIENRAIRRVGDNKEINIDVRIISSTNEKLSKLVKSNKFRQDLFYRINVVSMEIFPLRERKEDIELLCQHFIKHFNHIFNKNVKDLESDVKFLFMEYDWPGNVRELKNCLESAFNLVEGEYIKASHIPEYILYSNTNKNNLISSDNKPLSQLVDEYEKNILIKTIKMKKYNIVQTAKALGIPRQTLYYKLKKYNILDKIRA